MFEVQQISKYKGAIEVIKANFTENSNSLFF